MTIPVEIKYEALQLAVWYIELSFLFIFNYRGVYYNRTSGKAWKDGGENVPWM